MRVWTECLAPSMFQWGIVLNTVMIFFGVSSKFGDFVTT